MGEIRSECDAVLLHRWVGGDAIAGNELVRRHYAVVRAFLEKTSSEPADDLVQQTFLACMEHGHRFLGRSSVRTFLVGIAIHQLQARRRSLARDREVISVEAAGIDSKAAPHSASRVHAAEALLAQAFLGLEPDLLAIIDLVYRRGLTQGDVAKQLGVPPGTVASRLRRAKERLRELMRRMTEGDDTAAS